MWGRLKTESKPVVLYGTGDAAEKILKELDARGIRVSGIFASDGFVRDRVFAGFKVLSYQEACRRFGKMCVLLCFGSHRPEVIENIIRINREQDLYAPDLPVAGQGLFDREFYLKHKERLGSIRERLEDEQSRLVFDHVTEYKLTGRIDPLLECSTAEEENWKLLFETEDRQDAGRASGSENTAGLTFLDLGAYTGDTAALFIKLCGGRYSRIIAVEPEKRNFRKLTENLSAVSGTVLINSAAGSSDREIVIEKGRGRGGRIHQSGSDVPHSIRITQISADSILDSDPADIIKMDIEGAEAEAIEGAAKTIREHHPKMLIAAYHRTEDLFAIPEKVLAIRPDYKLFLRKDPCIPAWGINYIFI